VLPMQAMCISDGSVDDLCASIWESLSPTHLLDTPAVGTRMLAVSADTLAAAADTLAAAADTLAVVVGTLAVAVGTLAVAGSNQVEVLVTSWLC
jgi:hypothetical protein